MAFLPSTFNNSQVTWGQSNGGGLNPVLTYPNNLYSNPSGTALGEPGRVVNNNPEFTGQPITYTLPISALSDNSQMRYDRGDVLFVYRPGRDVENQYYATYAIWNLNYNLEMAYIRKREHAKNKSTNRAVSKVIETKVSHQDRLLDWPDTLQEFQDAIQYAGIFNTIVGGTSQRKRTAGVATKGAMTMPTIFKPDERGRNIGVGDTAYLHVGLFKGAHQGRMNIDGNLETAATVGKFLQVRGLWERDLQSPIGCSHFGEPSSYDADYITDMEIEQIDLPVDPRTGLVDTRAEPKRAPSIVVKKYEQGLLIKLGRVIRVTREPQIADIDDALRSEKGWKRLAKYSTVDLELLPCDVDVGF